MKESDAQKQIMDWLRLYRIFHYRQNTGGMSGAYKGKRWFVRFAKPGAPDIIAVVNGLYVGIEVKASDGKQSDKQREFQAELEAAQGVYILARNAADVEAKLGPMLRDGTAKKFVAERVLGHSGESHEAKS